MGLALYTAKEFLRERLTNDEPAAAIAAAAAAAGISENALRRAKRELKIVARKTPQGWFLRLPDPGPGNTGRQTRRHYRRRRGGKLLCPTTPQAAILGEEYDGDKTGLFSIF